MNDIDIEPVDISLIKKYKTVDVPCVHSEIHSINTSKGDTADVGIFSDNAKVSVYEFLEAAEIARMGKLCAES